MLLQCTFIGGLLSVVDLAELVIHAIEAFRHGFFHPVQLVTQVVVLAVRAMSVPPQDWSDSRSAWTSVRHRSGMDSRVRSPDMTSRR